jgi:methanogenic corrinoid protein MtbC1
LCRVSEATVKRWAETGLLTSERTSGGHRRFRAEEIARFQRCQGLGVKRCHGDSSIVTTRPRRRETRFFSGSELFHSLLAGCEEDAANLLISEYLRGKTPAEIFDGLMCPAMHQIGELWSAAELSVTEEHLATRAACNAVHKLRNVLTMPESAGDKLAMCCAVEGDFHELPTYLVQIVMEDEGWEVINFGANTPLYCLAEEIAHYRPQLVCVSATMIHDLERFSRDFREFAEQIEKMEIEMVLGGRAFSDDQTRRRLGAAQIIETFAELAERARDSIK